MAGAWGLAPPRPGKPVRSDRQAPSVEICLVGIGAKLMPEPPGDGLVCGLIMAGLAGALDPVLRVGDVVIDDCPTAALPAVAYRRGKICASPTLLSTPADKQAMFDRTRALAVDMESAAARQLAADWSVPFVSIRAISDAADESLDPAVLKLVDSFGRPRPLCIAATLVQRPSLIPHLRRLGAASSLAADHLAKAVRGIAQAWSEID